MHNLFYYAYPDVGDGVHSMARNPAEYVKAGLFISLVLFFVLYACFAGHEAIQTVEHRNTLTAALSGDVQAQFRLGMIYESWYGDRENAKEWYKIAAENGSEAANDILGKYF